MSDALSELMAMEKPKPKTFFDKLPESKQREMLDVKTAWRAGKLPSHHTKESIARYFIKRYSLPLAPQTIRRWLEEA